MGLLLAVVVHSAGIQDRAGARALLIRLFLHFEGLKPIFADGSYSGSLINWVLSVFSWNMQVIKRCQQRVFRVLPKRWVVQRTFAWLSQSRRLSKDYEVTALFSRSLREDRLHSAHDLAFGIVLGAGSGLIRSVVSAAANAHDASHRSPCVAARRRNWCLCRSA